MSEYIEKSALLRSLKSSGTASDFALYKISNFPTADVEPVVHGEWHYNENGRDFGLGAWGCSCCDTCNHNIPGNPNINPYIWSGSKFCPNCGAKMDGKERQNNE